MFLMKLFNKNYLIQNLKKSKAVLALALGLIPLLNTIIFLAYATPLKEPNVPYFSTLSIINFIGIYLLPLVLAVALFGFSFKKKQIDFIGSMPINRKTLYFTNLIGGILILIGIVALNIILMLIVNLFYPNVILPLGMIWDYFLFWSMSYIFVYTVVAFATTISSNAITSLVVTVLVLLLIPFMQDYIFNITGRTNNIYYQDSYSIKNDIAYDTSTISITPIIQNNFTVPYRLISSAITYFSAEPDVYNGTSIIKMFVLSIGYAIIGLWTFSKKKLEVSETSFRSFHIHTLVKCLTLIPLGLMYYYSLKNDIGLIGNIFILALLLAYYFIYDLITKKGISKVGLSIIYFAASMLFIIIFGATTDRIHDHQFRPVIKEDNIKAINMIMANNIGSNNRLNDVLVKNEEIIKEVVKQYNLYINSTSEEKEAWYLIDKNNTLGLNLKIVTKDNRQYYMYLPVTEDNYDYFTTIYTNSDDFIKEYKKIDYNHILVVSINDKTVKEKIKNLIVNSDSTKLNDLFNNNSNILDVSFNTYENHRLMSYEIDCSSDIELMNQVGKMYNNNIKEDLAKNANLIASSITTSVPSDINYNEFVINEINSNIVAFIKNHTNDPIDFTKPYLAISIYNYYTGKNYHYFSNATTEFNNMYNEASKDIEIPNYYKDMENDLNESHD